jgi:RHS repeat-associated protein
MVDPDNNPGPSPLPPTIIVVEPLICGCAVQPMLPVTDENFYVPAEFIEFENHSIKELSFYLYDHLGNTRMTYRILPTASATFTIEEMMDYDPYGKILRHYSTGGEKYLTTQHQRDTETGLDYRGARFYDCDVARFLSVDPSSSNYPSNCTFNYVMGNPCALVDPDGRDPYDPRTGKSYSLSYSKASILDHTSLLAIRGRSKSPDNEMLSDINNPFFQNIGNAGRIEPSDQYEADWNHSSVWGSLRSNTIKAIQELTDVSLNGDYVSQEAWQTAAENGTYVFLDNRWSESEVFRWDLTDFNIFSVESNRITQEVHMSRSDGNSDYQIASVSTFKYSFGSWQSRQVNKGGRETTEYYRTVTTQEDQIFYENNSSTGAGIRTYRSFEETR